MAITVAGLGSTSTDASIDALRTRELGYDDGDVLRFSYRGGVVPSAAGAAGSVRGRRPRLPLGRHARPT